MKKPALTLSLTARILLVFALILILLASCTHNDGHIPDKLRTAKQVVNENPEKALALLDSILNPNELNEDVYMQYLVAHTQAKYKSYKDITSDTLVFVAQRYFESKQDVSNSALASYYAGAVCFERDNKDEALSYFRKSHDYSVIDGDQLSQARSYHFIGSVYFSRMILDSTIANYKQALRCYEQTNNIEYRLEVTALIGRAYSYFNKNDSSFVYFDRGYKLASELDNEPYKATFSHLLSIVNRNAGEYDKSFEYLYSALATTVNPEEKYRICLSLAKNYTIINRLDSARKYVDIVESGISTAANDYVLRGVCNALIDYNNQEGDYKKALHYTQMLREVESKITASQNREKLLMADQRYALSLKDKELKNEQMRMYLYLGIAAFALLAVLVAFYIKARNAKHKHEKEVEKNRLLEARNQLLDQKIESLVFLQGIYRNLVGEWNVIDKEMSDLAREYGTEEKPAFYKRIEHLVETLRTNSREQLLVWAKGYLAGQSFGNEVLLKLKNDDLILLVLCYCRYPKDEIAELLGIQPQKVYPRKLALKHDLLEIGLPEIQIQQALFE